MKNLLSIQSLSGNQILNILRRTDTMKRERCRHPAQPLAHQIWALIFSKSSTRTRVSFEAGIRELGGSVMFLAADDIQLGRGEPICDTARVLGRMIHGAVIRTFEQKEVAEFAEFSGIPTINALTDEEHPCQILADLFTIQESLPDGVLAGRAASSPDGQLSGKSRFKDLSVCFVGDGSCNVARSWIWAAAHLGFSLRIASPLPYQPSAELLSIAGSHVTVTDDLQAAIKDSKVVYTDVWVSMGKEQEASDRLKQLEGYQINNALLADAAPNAMVMHCLPAYRGKEITKEVFEAHAETIFRQAENRLHTQKTILEAVVQDSL